MQQCDCRAEINFTVEFADFKVLDKTSHEYQFMGFIYACVMLFNYFSLTTFIMIKLMLFKPARPPLSLEMDESKKANEDMLKQFREREKKVNEAFEIQARKQVKQQMINYLQSMQTLSGLAGALRPSASVDTTASGQDPPSSSAAEQSEVRQEDEDEDQVEPEEEEDDIEIWRTRYEWEQNCQRRYERRMGISAYESEGDDDSMTEYFL